MSKAYPCGAGLGLMGVATDGDVALCHRFAGSDEHKLGSVFDGIDHSRQDDFLLKHHIANKTDCATCWARPLCAGGCYHEAHTRYGSTVEPNLHYCEWIRAWTNTCLEVYGRSRRQEARVSDAVRLTGPPVHLFTGPPAHATSDADQPEGPPHRSDHRERRRGAPTGRAGGRPGRTCHSGVRSCFRRGGRWTRAAVPRDSASRWSEICSTATSRASGRPTCPICTTTLRIGPRSARPRRRTGARSISSFHECRHPREQTAMRQSPTRRAGDRAAVLVALSPLALVAQSVKQTSAAIPFPRAATARSTSARTRATCSCSTKRR